MRRRRFFESIRDRLTLLVLLGFLPGIGLAFSHLSLHHSQTRLIQDVLALLIVAFFAMVATRLYGERAILRAARSMLKAAGRFAAGAKLRPNQPGESREMKELSLAFNEVVGSLQEELAQRRQAEADLRKAYDRLKATQAELIQAEKLSALGRFSAGVAHEVKNPLGIILNWADFLQRKMPEADPQTKEALASIKTSVLRANDVVKGLMSFARPSPLQRERVQLEEVVEAALTSMKASAVLSKVEVQKNFSSKEKLWVHADRDQIQQVLVNLLGNAADAMPEGGKIVVKVYPRQREGDSQAEGVVEITDTGGGISKENLSRLFEPFFTTKQDKKGNGLGLAVSKTIMENHRGDLVLESQESKGTTAKVILPIANGGS